MSIKKLLILASMAFATVAFAVPASASASQWRDGGVPIGAPVNLSATGTYQFNTVLGGIHCQNATIDFTIKNEGGVARGTYTAFTATHSAECHGSGSLEGCTVAQSELTTPSSMHPDPNDPESVTATNITLWMSYVDAEPGSGDCSIEETELDLLTSNGHDETWIFHRVPPGGPGTPVTKITILYPSGGNLTAFGLEVEGVEGEANLTINAPNHGTYGLS